METKKFDEATTMFVNQFIEVLNTDGLVSFGELFIGFVAAPKVLGQVFIKAGVITESQLANLNEELDKAMETVSYDKQVEEIIERIKEEKNGGKDK